MRRLIARRVSEILRAASSPNQGLSPDVARVLQHVEAMMEACELKPGERLIEADLAAQLSVGRGRVREALRILAGQGAVELRANQGARLRALSPDELASIFEAGAGLYIVAYTGFLRRYSDLPQAAFEDVAFCWDKISDAWLEETPFLRKVKYLRLLSNYLLVISYYSGNAYLNRLHYNLNYTLDSMELAKLLDEGFIQLMNNAYKEVHSELMTGSEKAVALFGDMAQIIVTHLRTISR